MSFAGMTIIGLIMPAIISLVKQTKWKGKAKLLTAVICCVIAGGYSAFLTGSIASLGFLNTIGYIFTISHIVYKVFWEDYCDDFLTAYTDISYLKGLRK